MGPQVTPRQRTLVVEDVYCVEVGAGHTAWLRGPQAGKVLLRLELAKMYDHSAGCWSFSRRRVDDVVRELHRRRRSVEVVEVAR